MSTFYEVPFPDPQQPYGSDEVAKLRVMLAEAERRQASDQTVARFVDGNERVANSIHEEVLRRRGQVATGMPGSRDDYVAGRTNHGGDFSDYNQKSETHRWFRKRNVAIGVVALGAIAAIVYIPYGLNHPKPLNLHTDNPYDPTPGYAVASASAKPSDAPKNRHTSAALPTESLVTSLPTLTPSPTAAPSLEASVSPTPTEAVVPTSEPTPTSLPTTGTTGGGHHHSTHTHKPKKHHHHVHMIPDVATYGIAPAQTGGEAR